MYRRYYNEYEKKAQQIKSETAPQPPKPETKPPSSPPKASSPRYDDILLLGLIFFLVKEGTADKTLILALGFIFMSGF